jgi:hypothetical protein
MVRTLLASLLTLGTLAALSETRPATDAEKAWGSKVLAACTKAIPPGPEGWEVKEKPDPSCPANVEAGAPGAPIALAVSGAWNAPAPKAAKKDPKEEALLDKQAQAAESLRLADEKQDNAAVERILKEIEEIGAQLEKIEAGRKAEKPEAAAAPKETFLKIRIEANALSIPLPKGAKALPPVGEFKAYRVGDDAPGAAEPGTTLVLIGSWSEKGDAGAQRLEAAKLPKAAPASVQAIAVRVQAAPALAKSVLDKMDLASLKALLGK